jgi:hypothetical protein
MRLKKSTPAAKSKRLKKSALAKRIARLRKSVPFTPEVAVAAVAVAVICVGVGAMLSAVLQPNEPPTARSARTPPASTPPQYFPSMPDTIPDYIVADGSDPAAAAPSAVTITGCLERDDETFRLKNTTGTQAPKARSWKSGFLKKNSASIDIVAAANRVRLPNHVGQRVVVTGTLVDREMRVRSLRSVAASCNQDA